MTEVIAKPEVQDTRVVGTRPIRPDGADKVTGRATYGADFNLPGQLVGKVLRSPHPHARIISIDTLAAEAHPKVRAVITGETLRQRNLAWMPTLSGDTQAVLATDKVRFQGQEVAFVVAEDRYSARDALELIDVEYEPLPAVIDARRALDAGAPVIRDDLEHKTDNHIFDWEAGDAARTEQVFRDAVACLAVFATVLFLVIRYHGAVLDAPADPSEPFSAARPEWYFLFLFQLLKYFPGGTEIWGAIVLPTLLLVVLVAMPFLGKWKLGHRFNLGLLWSVLAGAVLLTWIAKKEDASNADYLTAVQAAERAADRVVVLAQGPSGIPPTGAVSLLRGDALTQGPKLFARNCASCHRFGGEDGLGGEPKDAPTASDLKGFASREWLAGLLDPRQITTVHYFGGSKLKTGKMSRFVTEQISQFAPDEKTELNKALVALSAEAGLTAQHDADVRDAALITAGREALSGDILTCTSCHKFHDADENGGAPDLTGYGSRDWLIAFISNPAHERFYGGRNDRMPAFGADQRLTAQEIGLIADWLRGDWYVAPAGK